MNPRKSQRSTDQNRTKKLYSYQWNHFRVIRADEDRATFRNRTGWSEKDLADTLVLDAGCGMGRYARGERDGSKGDWDGPQLVGLGRTGTERREFSTRVFARRFVADAVRRRNV